MNNNCPFVQMKVIQSLWFHPNYWMEFLVQFFHFPIQLYHWLHLIWHCFLQRLDSSIMNESIQVATLLQRRNRMHKVEQSSNNFPANLAWLLHIRQFFRHERQHETLLRVRRGGILIFFSYHRHGARHRSLKAHI